MAPSHHLIRRQTLRVTVGDADAGERLLPRLQAVALNAVPEMLERCFDAVVPADRTERLERLEIDVGSLRAASLEQDLMAGLLRALPAVLADALPDTRDEDRTDLSRAADAARPSPVAVLAFFAGTGRLPWWRPGWRTVSLAAILREAAETQPVLLADLLQNLAHQGAPLDRLLRHVNDDALADALSRLAPAAADARAVLATLSTIPALAGLTADLRRRLFWRATVLASADPSLTSAAELWRAVTTQLAAAPGGAADGPEAGAVAGPAEAERLAVLRRRMDAALQPAGPLGPLFARLRSVLAMLTDEAALARSIAAADRLRALLAADAALPPAVAGLAAEIERLAAAEIVARWLAAIDPLAPAAAKTTADDGDQADACYVENAGIVLMWPFLPRFFANLGLLTASETFVDGDAARRAATALHGIATGEAEAPEYWLPLNKILCGLAIDAPCPVDRPLDDRELDEADRVVAAALAHAALPSEPTIAAFRQMFLLRAGTVSTRDGAWLLRVERTDDDAVLDRLPWTLQWIKLPWMPAPVRIEW